MKSGAKEKFNKAEKMMLFSLVVFALSNGAAQQNIVSKNIRTENIESKTKRPLQGTSAKPIVSEVEGLGGAGMMFTQNKGQIVDMAQHLRPDILFKGDGGGADVYLRKTGVSYVLNNMTEVMHEIEERVEDMIKAGEITHEQEQEKKSELEQNTFLKIHRVDVDFVDGNADPETITADPVEGYNNYYFGHCPQGITRVNSFNEVTRKNVYPGVDVKYYGGKEKGLKYDIIINPGGDPDQIKLKYSGANELKIKNGNGSTGRTTRLVIETSVGELGEYIPKVYQNINGKIVDINTEYRLETLSNNDAIVTFSFSDYNSSFPLVIDPWATYFGGSWNEWGVGITTDPLGNVLFTGASGSANFPITAGAFQTIVPNFSAFAVKLTSNGNRLWATFIGGNNQQQGFGISTDVSGNVYVSGYTYSLDFPVGASVGNFVHQNAYGGGTADAFLIKFDPTGARLWSTCYGGNSYDAGTDIINDGNNVYLYGYSSSSNGISTPAVFQPGLNGGGDVFVVKFSGNGIRIWGTYVGGSGGESCGGGIAIDQSGNIYISGGTTSNNFPVGSIPPNIVFQSVTANGFVFKFDPAGTRLWATYYGGINSAIDAAVDNNSNLIITAPNGIMKFNGVGNQLWVLNNPISGPGPQIRALAVDGSNNIYVYGEWEDINPGIAMSPCAYKASMSAGDIEDPFIAKYDLNGVQRCITFVGGNGEDEADFAVGNAITIKGNDLYLTGSSYGSYPVTPGVFQTIYSGAPGGSGGGDAIVNKLCINICETKVQALNFTATTTNLCINKTVTYTPSLNAACDTTGLRFKWTFTGGYPSTSTDQKPVISYSSPGSYPVKLVLTTTCKNDSVIKPSFITVSSCGCAISASAAVMSNVNCSGNGTANVSITNGSGGPYTYNWSNGASGTTSAVIISITGLSAGTYSVTVTDGACASITAVTLTQSLSTNNITPTNILCHGGNNGSATVTVNGGTGTYTYNWSNGASSTTSLTNNSITNLKAGTYTVTIKDGTCILTSNVTIMQPDPILVAFSNQVPCSSTLGTATANPQNGNPPYTYLWSNGSTTQSVAGLNGGSSYNVTVTDKNNCSVIQTDYIVIPTRIVLGSSGSTNVSCTTSGYAYINFTGVPPLTYVWSTGKSGVINIQSGFTNLTPPAGNYTITITDGYGCSATKAFAISGTSPVSATFASPPTSCMGASTCFTNTGSTGIYTWTIGPPVNVSGTSANFCYTFLTAGTYSVSHTVTNAGCTNTIEKQVTVLNCSGPTVTVIANTVCAGSCATITSSPAGGTMPYTYSWSNGATTQNISPCPLTTTTYTVTIKDTGGNTSTSSVIVTINPAVIVTTSVSNINCNGGTGSITASGSGSTPYTYNWSVPGGSGSTVSGLTAGNYTVTITDSKGCSGTSSVILILPPSLTGQFTKGTASCAGCGCKEWLMVNATGGTSPYSYSWPNGYSNRYQNKLCPGNYMINITDKNGCSVSMTVSAP